MFAGFAKAELPPANLSLLEGSSYERSRSTSTWTRPSPRWTITPCASSRRLRRRSGAGDTRGSAFLHLPRRCPCTRGRLEHRHCPLSLRENVSRADEELIKRIAKAEAPFWRHVRAALAGRHA